jgi:PqqD family protein of HPr-rel-A system
MTTRWRVDEDCTLLWRCWDDEYVVYNTASGDTHLLNRVAAETLLLLEQSPSDAQDLTVQVARKLALQPSEELGQQLEQLLTQFEELGLVGKS